MTTTAVSSAAHIPTSTPWATERLTRRLAAFDARIDEADGPGAQVVAALNSVRAVMRHVPPKYAAAGAAELVHLTRRIFQDLITTRHDTKEDTP